VPSHVVLGRPIHGLSDGHRSGPGADRGGWMVVGLLGMLLSRELTIGEFLFWTLSFAGLLAHHPRLGRFRSLPAAHPAHRRFGRGRAYVVVAGRAPRRPAAARAGPGALPARHPRTPGYSLQLQQARDLYYQSGNWGTAVEWYEKSLKVHPDPACAPHARQGARATRPRSGAADTVPVRQAQLARRPPSVSTAARTSGAAASS